MLACCVAELIEKDKQEKAPESTLKMLWNSPFKLTRAIPELLRIWLHTKAFPEKSAIRFLQTIEQSTQTHMRMGEQQASSKSPISHQKWVNSTCSHTCSWDLSVPKHLGMWALRAVCYSTHKKLEQDRKLQAVLRGRCACTRTCVRLFVFSVYSYLISATRAL